MFGKEEVEERWLAWKYLTGSFSAEEPYTYNVQEGIYSLDGLAVRKFYVRGTSAYGNNLEHTSRMDASESPTRSL